MSAVASIINLKGGVGKSTLAMIIGEYLAFNYGKKVLLIDMDAQGNLSYCMVSEANIDAQFRYGRTIYHLFRQALSGNVHDIADYTTQPPLAVSNVSRSSAVPYPGVLAIVVSNPNVAQLDEDLLS